MNYPRFFIIFFQELWNLQISVLYIFKFFLQETKIWIVLYLVRVLSTGPLVSEKDLRRTESKKGAK